jgi:hypothetical protein
MPSRLSRALRRPTLEQLEDDELQRSADAAGCRLLASQSDRAVCSIHGEIRSVTTRPVSDGVPALEAQLYDGSGNLTLVWLGRREITGIEPGRRLTVHGRIGRRGESCVLYNPRYELDA